MADPFGAFADPGGEELQADEFYRGLNFLGRPASITLPGQEPSPAGTEAGLAAGGPTTAGGTATGLPGVGAGSGAVGLPSTGISPALRALLTGAAFAGRASNIPDLFSEGPPAGAFQTPSGQLTTSAPEILRDIQFPDFPASAVPDFPGIGIETAPAEAAGGGATTGLGDVLGGVSEALPYLGGVVPLVSSLARGGPQTPAQTANLLVDIGGASLAPLTFGASAAAGGIARGIEDIIGGAPWYQSLLDFAGLGWLRSLFDKPGGYIPKRQEAGRTAGEDVSGQVSAMQQAAQDLESGGGLGPALGALQGVSADVSALPGRNPVRSEVWLPPELAAQFGVSGPEAGGVQRVPWSAFSPDSFGQFLSAYAADPATYGGYIRGSGDVAYLPQAQAEAVAAREQQNTQAFLDALVGGRTATPAAPAAATPEPTSVDTATAGLFDFGTPGTEGQIFPFETA